MKRVAVVLGLLLLVFSGFAYVRYVKPSGQDSSSPHIIIKGQRVNVRVADTDPERAHGLSGTDPLPENEGMLFIFEREYSGSFWMNEMKYALDIIWIKNNLIIDIHESVPPPAQTNNIPQVVSPRESATHVLEVIGGWSKKREVGVNDKIEFYL